MYLTTVCTGRIGGKGGIPLQQGDFKSLILPFLTTVSDFLENDTLQANFFLPNSSEANLSSKKITVGQ